MQTIYSGEGSYKKIFEELKSRNCKKFLLVCGKSFDSLPMAEGILNSEIPFVRFGGFTPNPTYDEVCDGIRVFKEEGCDSIVAVGGGSPMDVAKCIKLFSAMDEKENYFLQEMQDTGIPLFALPTTAGTGSESTRFSVIYYEGEKKSVAHESIIPDVVILDSSVLYSLPVFQKKCTLLDALCQGIEGWWSVNSTPESWKYGKLAVENIMRYKDGYMEGEEFATEKILLASNDAGQSINIARTTAAHAMSYKITTRYGTPHGFAVALCLPKIWRYMQTHTQLCLDKRGEAHVKQVFEDIAKSLGAQSVEEAIEIFENLLNEWGMYAPKLTSRKKELKILASSVNAQRLSNNPIELSEEALYQIYEQVFKEE